MGAAISALQFIDDARILLHLANEKILSQRDDQKYVFSFMEINQEWLEYGELLIDTPNLALRRATEVVINIAKTVFDFFESQLLFQDESEIINDLEVITIAQNDPAFPDEKNGDIFEQASNLMAACERVVNFVIKKSPKSTKPESVNSLLDSENKKW